MHETDITTLEHQASHRATTANQAWAWAKAIEHLAHSINGINLAQRARSGSPLAWLECEMAWTCEDLEDAGAWPCDLNLVTDHPSHGLGGVVGLGQVAEAPHSFILGAGCIRVCVQL